MHQAELSGGFLLTTANSLQAAPELTCTDEDGHFINR